MIELKGYLWIDDFFSPETVELLRGHPEYELSCEKSTLLGLCQFIHDFIV